MIKHNDISDPEVRKRIRAKTIVIAGNQQLMIYGALNCKSGKRMLKDNRVFFSSENEAIQAGFRPCGHCQRTKYKAWKQAQTKA